MILTHFLRRFGLTSTLPSIWFSSFRLPLTQHRSFLLQQSPAHACNMMWHVYPPPHGYSPRVGDEVFIRPKTGKELGLTGRVTDLVDDESQPPATAPAAASANNSNSTTTKKRKREEPTRAVVSIHSTTESNANANDVDGDTCAGRTSREVTSRPSRLVKVYTSSSNSSHVASQSCYGGSDKMRHRPQIVVTSDTVNYRILAASQVKSDDFVLEIGCSTGECTAILARYVSSPSRIVAFDTGESMIAAAKKRVAEEQKQLKEVGGARANNGAVSFYKIDALQDPRGALKAIQTSTSVARGDEDKKDGATNSDSQPKYPDVVFIDIGGNREIKGVVRMMHWVLDAFQSQPPRLIVVKSQELVGELRLASRNNTLLLNIDDKDGTVHYGQDWFLLLVDSIVDQANGGGNDNKDESQVGTGNNGRGRSGGGGPPRFSHPLKAPLALSPVDDATPICRFHNYHPEGCKKAESCDFDHDHCHFCLKKGHVARNCCEG